MVTAYFFYFFIGLVDFSTMETYLRFDLHDTVAISMDFWYDSDNPDCEESMLLYGTDQGYVVMFNFVNNALFNKNRSKDECQVINVETYFKQTTSTPTPGATFSAATVNSNLINMSNNKANLACLSKRKAHGDWVQKVRYYHDLHAIVSCSTDPQASLCVATQDGKNKWVYFTTPVHKGVTTFAYCRFPVVLITGGTDHQLRLWNPHRLHHPMAALKGHNAPVIDITVNEMSGQIISLSTDNVIKVWDIRKQQCIQTIADSAAELKPEQGLNVIHFAPELEGQLLAASMSIVKYKHKVNNSGGDPAMTTTRSHDSPLRAALYNESFKQIVTGCDGGIVNVWVSHRVVCCTWQ
jgi:WD40 repeat protein